MTATLNLDALSAFADLDNAGQVGKPLLLDIQTVHEDPDQPRKDFDPVALSELTESIRESGVKSPVSVRTHPDIADHYMLNFGARRLRASKAAGQSTIPAFVDEAHTDFEQVVENLQRDGLTPMEMALFIQAKVKAGVKKGAIAKKLGISNGAVSKYLVLIDGPSEVEALYSSGKCRSPDTLYEVAGLLSKWPDQTRSWMSTQGEVTRTSVDALKKRLSTAPASSPKLDPPLETERAQPQRRASQTGEGIVNAPTEPSPGAQPQSIISPVLHVIVDGRQGILLLDKRPMKGHLIIQWGGTTDYEEVPAQSVSIERLADIHD